MPDWTVAPWTDLKKLFDDAFSASPPLGLADRLDTIRAAAGELGEAGEALLQLLDRRIPVLTPHRSESEPDVSIRMPAPDLEEELASAVEWLEWHFRAATGLAAAGCRDPWVDEVLIPRLGLALLVAEQAASRAGRPPPDIVARTRRFLGAAHPVLPENRLAGWPQSAAWADFKRIWSGLEASGDVNELILHARDSWHSAMASALPGREDLAARLYGAIAALYQWRMTRDSWSFEPRRADSLRFVLELAGHSYRALCALRATQAADAWIEQTFAPSVAHFADQLVEVLALHSNDAESDDVGEEGLPRRARKALESIRAGATLGSWSHWT